MDKKEIETRYQHKYPGYKTVEKLNDKLRDVDLHGRSQANGDS